ncbi:tripeptidylpeptidase II, partial [Reticulomyxa filosa]
MEKMKNEKLGPVFDVIVWHNGNEWLGVLETSSAREYFECCKGEDSNLNEESKQEVVNSGDSKDSKDSGSDGGEVVDLSACKPMTNYRVRHEYDFISKHDMLVYSLNIYDNGNLVSVV